MNLTSDAPLTLVGQLADLQWKPILREESSDSPDGLSIGSAADLAVTLAAERPDVLAAQADASAAAANVDLARASRVPNVAIGPVYQRDEAGSVFAGFQTQMDLPVWDTGRPLVRQRVAEYQQRSAVLAQWQSRARVEAQTAIERYERARQFVRRERPVAGRTIPDELQRIRTQFEAGQADILNVFATQSALWQEQRTYLDLLNELAQAASEVTLAAGLPPAQLMAAPPSALPNSD